MHLRIFILVIISCILSLNTIRIDHNINDLYESVGINHYNKLNHYISSNSEDDLLS